jgi:hypothetical protein
VVNIIRVENMTERERVERGKERELHLREAPPHQLQQLVVSLQPAPLQRVVLPQPPLHQLQQLEAPLQSVATLQHPQQGEHLLQLIHYQALVPPVPPLLLQLRRLEVLHLPHLFPPWVELVLALCLPPVEPPLRPILSQVPPVPLVPLVLLHLYLPQAELPEPLLYLQQAPTLQHLSVQQLVQVQVLTLLSHHLEPQLVLLPPPVPHHPLLPQPAQQLSLLQQTLPVKEQPQKLAHLAPPKVSGLALTELTTKDVPPVSGLLCNLWLLAQLAQPA